jgi:hypothetical protein
MSHTLVCIWRWIHFIGQPVVGVRAHFCRNGGMPGATRLMHGWYRVGLGTTLRTGKAVPGKSLNA